LVIDNPSKGLFLPAYLQTACAAFGPDNVALIVDERKPNGSQIESMTKRSTVIVVASKSKVDWDDFEKHLNKREQSGQATISHVFRPKDVETYLGTRTRERSWFEHLFGRTDPVPWTPPVLTDDYAPVDNLTAPMFEEAYGFVKKKATQSSERHKPSAEKK
jgi:hypothetical protein